MRKILLIFCIVIFSLSATAQDNMRHNRERRHFDPQKFEQQLEQFVLKKAEINQTESAKFLPLFREMRQKELSVMRESRRVLKGKPTTEEECEAAIKSHDNSEVQLKKIQQTYHLRMLKVLKASKLLKACLATEEFHREAFKRVHDQRGSRIKGFHGRHRGQRADDSK